VESFEQAPLGIRLLGGFAVRVGGRPVPEEAWRLRRAKSLVKLLALAPERRVHREQVTELLWPGRAPAANALHQVLYTARRAVARDEGAGDRLVLRDDAVALAGEGIWVDVDVFERAAAQARTQRTVAAYRAALELYAGELLPEDRYEEWTTTRRESLRETRLGLLVESAAAHGAAGDAAAAIEALQRAVVEDPLHEAAHRELMRLFADGGRRQQALAQYQQLRDALRRTLEADPDPETRRLYREILAGQHPPQAAAERQPAPARGRAPRAPPLSPARPAPPASSPALGHQLTSFVGRERELRELDGQLGRTRLLTLTGPGGSGKTRLALALAARRAGASADATRVVELAPVSDPALVAEETAAAIGVTPRSERDPVELLGEQIGDAPLLLVLDNCEHLVDACARLADRLLRACPNLRLLATSREQLRIPGEVAWRVPPLSLPELPLAPGRAAVAGAAGEADAAGAADGAAAAGGVEDAHAAGLALLERSEAIRLFCQRAGDAAPGFALAPGNAAAVAEICRRLDGMPLALELAAARVAVLSPQQIAARLGDALTLLRGGDRAGLTRQQTLRATLTWSHELLGSPERVLYRRLGVFAGSFGVEAIDGVCADADGTCAGSAPLDLLAQLAEKSLVQVEPGAGSYRYRLLETVRQHAREQLAQAGERARLEAAHRAWYLAIAEAADRDVDPGAAAAWPVERVEAEHDDLRAALASAIRDDPPAGLRLASALWWFWMARGYFVEGSRWFDEALAAAPEPTPARVRALWALGGIDVRRRGTIRTVGLGADALEIARRSGDRRAEARALERRGVLAMGGFDWPVADAALAEGMALAQELGDAPVAVAIAQAQGVLAGCRGETGRARALLQRSLALLDQIDERGPLFWALHISPVALPVGPDGAPRSFFEDTFCLFRAVGSGAGAAYVLLNVGEAWRADGAEEPAREALEESLERFRAVGDDQGAGVALNALGNLERSAGDAEAGRRRFEQALSLRRAARDPREIATTLIGMGMLALSVGEAERGRALFGEAEAIFERTEDGPGLQAIPLDLGAFALDHGDPRRACALLERCVRLSRRRRIVPIVGWALAELGEAAGAIGDRERARAAVAEALPLLERSGVGRGVRYARAVQARLETPASAR
jgi:predicted ATPase/DNA-binding SARP family transcriptional activator